MKHYYKILYTWTELKSHFQDQIKTIICTIGRNRHDVILRRNLSLFYIHLWPVVGQSQSTEKKGGRAHLCAGSRQGEQADGRVGQTWPIRWKGAEAQECGNICTRRAYRHCAPSLDTPRHDRLLLFPHLKHTTFTLQFERNTALPFYIGWPWKRVLVIKTGMVAFLDLITLKWVQVIKTGVNLVYIRWPKNKTKLANLARTHFTSGDHKMGQSDKNWREPTPHVPTVCWTSSWYKTLHTVCLSVEARRDWPFIHRAV